MIDQAPNVRFLRASRDVMLKLREPRIIIALQNMCLTHNIIQKPVWQIASIILTLGQSS